MHNKEAWRLVNEGVQITTHSEGEQGLRSERARTELSFCDLNVRADILGQFSSGLGWVLEDLGHTPHVLVASRCD